jgi:hypothetical protein
LEEEDSSSPKGACLGEPTGQWAQESKDLVGVPSSGHPAVAVDGGWEQSKFYNRYLLAGVEQKVIKYLISIGLKNV